MLVSRRRLGLASPTLVAILGFTVGCASVPGPRGAAPDNPAPVPVSRRSPLPWDLLENNAHQYAERGQSALLHEGAGLRWSVESATARPSRFMSGRAVVGPDGTIEVGPYGTIHVAGLTMPQARVAVTNHLSTYLANPQVGLATESDPY